jgi:hypothetical protein
MTLVSFWRLPLVLAGRVKDLYKKIKADFKEPLPELEGLPKSKRIKARFRIIYKKYGWKILAIIFIYYLVRDVLVYIVLPYLVARGLIGG